MDRSSVWLGVGLGAMGSLGSLKVGHCDGVDSQLSIVVPAYNEEGSIVELIDRVRRAVPLSEVVVVDDGSTDRTYERAFGTGVRVVRHRVNMGKAYALKTGYRSASHDTLVTIDADCSYPPEEIPSLLRKLGEADLVVGSRFLGGFAKGLSLPRNLANHIGAIIFSILNGRRITDATSGLRAFRRELAELPTRARGLDYEVEFTTLAIRKGYRYAEVPIAFHERRGTSKLRFFRDCLRFLIAGLRARFS